MILVFVLVGFVVGAVSAGYTLAVGGGILAALAAYSICGALAVVITAFFMAVGPTLFRQKPASGIPVRAQVQRR